MSKFKEKKGEIRFWRISLNTSLALIMAGSFLLPNFADSVNITGNNIIELTNQERIKNGIGELKENHLLKEAALNKARDIIKNETFSHTLNNISFSKWIKETGYEYSFIGENLAIDFVSSEGVVNAWLKSPTHKENLLNEKFKEIGVVVLEEKFNNSNTILVVQIFGTPTIQVEDLISKQNITKNEEKLLIRVEDNKIISNESNKIIARTIEYNPVNQLNSNLLNENPLSSNSQIGEFYSILFAIIISSLIVSIMFPDGIKIKKISLKFFKKIIQRIN